MRLFRYIALVALLALATRGADASGRIIYPEPSAAKSDLATALKRASVEHKRVLLDFGGNWCGDCQVLDIYFQDPANKPLLDANFILVHISVGDHGEDNQDLAEHYGVPLNKGVPALAVLSERGELLFSQKHGEFEAMRRMESSSVTRFLTEWRVAKPGCSTVMISC